MTLEIVFVKLSQLSVLLPCLTGISRFRRLNKTFKTLLFFFVFSLLIEVLASVSKVIYRTNMPLLHIFTLVEFSILLYVFLAFFQRNCTIRISILLLYIIFAFLAILDLLVFKGPLLPNTFSRTFGSLVLTFLSLLYYLRFFRESTDEIVWRQSMFWFSTAVLVYFSLNVFFFMMFNVFLSLDYKFADIGVNLHDGYNIIANALFAAVFIWNRDQEI
jgi:hypothetical protein